MLGLAGKAFNGWLIALAVVAGVTLVLPWLVVVAMISIIGIPLALIMCATPTLFLVSLVARMVQIRLGGGWLAFAGGAIIALALLAIPPLLINAKLESRAQALVAGDHNDLVQAPKPRVLAIRLARGTFAGKDRVQCDDACLSALLNGQVERMLVAYRQDLIAPLDLDTPVLSYRMETRPACPNLQVGDERAAGNLMRLETAKGHCLIEEKVPLSLADVVVSAGQVADGSDAYGAGLDMTADTVRASRIAVHVRREGAFDEVYRRTSVVTEKLFPILAPTVVPGYGLDIAPGFFRIAERRNMPDAYSSLEPDWHAFVANDLGLDLVLKPEDAGRDVRNIIAAVLDGSAALDEPKRAVIDDFFEGLREVRTIDGEDARLITRVLADRRISIPFDASLAVSRAKAQEPAYFVELARLFFARLKEISLFANGKFNYQAADQVRSLANAIAALPDDAIHPYRDEIERLAHERDLRVVAHRALARLSVFGADAVPTLLFLMDDGHRVQAELNRKYPFGDWSDWHEPYRAGMIGLCRIGRNAAMIQPLLDRLDAGVVKKREALTIHTLLARPADREEIWKRVRTGETDEDRRDFDAEVARATRRNEC
jgi:hypothetical protein